MNNNATSSFLQQFRIVFGFIFELRPFFFGIQEEENDDLEAGPPEEVQNSVFEKALSILLTLPASFLLFTLPGVLCFAQIKWQLTPLGSPSPTLHKWYIICVSSLITEFAASIAQWIISTAGSNPTSVYNTTFGLARIACCFLFLVSLAVMDHRVLRHLKPAQVNQRQPFYEHIKFLYSVIDQGVCLE